VGYNNHRYFFMFLFTLTQFCAYGFYLCFQVYRGMVIEWGLDQAYLFDRRTGKQVPLSFRKAMIVSTSAPSFTSTFYSLGIINAAHLA
jgi:palmitoyltransferase